MVSSSRQLSGHLVRPLIVHSHFSKWHLELCAFLAFNSISRTSRTTNLGSLLVRIYHQARAESRFKHCIAALATLQYWHSGG